MIGPTGATGPTGPTGSEGPSGGGFLIPYATSQLNTLRADADGNPENVLLVSFGMSDMNAVYSNGVINISSSLVNLAFLLPASYVITDIDASFTLKEDMAIGEGEAVTIIARLYENDPGNILRFIPLEGTKVEILVSRQMVAGNVVQSWLEDINVRMRPHDFLLLAFALACSGITGEKTISGFANASVAIKRQV